ncbi:Glycosyl transferases group 1 [Ruminococcaceae bacterium KH2T8]|nr:Glycosyl transferases group 1 [Ruminococcaceae bacterium KH2T8]
MSKKNLLWVSYFVPYDKVQHAGGKIHNFYLKGIQKTGKYNIKLLTCAKEEELDSIDLDKAEIEYHLYISRKTEKFKTFVEKVDYWSFWRTRSGFTSRYKRDFFINSLLDLKNSGYAPDVIVLQWTQVVLIESEIKKIYPHVPVICIEEDVSYQSFYRRYLHEKNLVKKFLRKMVYLQLKKLELECLRRADLIILNNSKDKKMLNEQSIDNIWVWTPYFQDFSYKEHLGDRNELLFYGAMSRDENWKSVIWFVDNVLPYIKNKEVKLVVVGGNPHKELLKINNPRVELTGYVDDVSEYFSRSKCLVAPLVLGAGVKIKVLEAMSAGLPVITNNIGIEGISAKDRIDYFHCETPDEYINVINAILDDCYDLREISMNSKNVIRTNYDIDKSLGLFDLELDRLSVKK